MLTRDEANKLALLLAGLFEAFDAYAEAVQHDDLRRHGLRAVIEATKERLERYVDELR